MQDYTEINQLIEGISARLKGLRAEEQLLLKASGLEQQIAKASAQSRAMEADIAKNKAEYDELAAQLGKLTGDAMANFLVRMDAALPEGKAYLRIGEKSVAMGWSIEGVERPVMALSGGERVAYDAALAHALGAGILIKEVSELDPGRLDAVMARLSEIKSQLILVTCHPPQTVPASWTVIKTGQEGP